MPVTRSDVFRHVVDLLADPFTVRRTRDGRVVQANEAFARQVGLGLDEILGERLEDLSIQFRPEDRRRYEERLADRGEVQEARMRFLNHRGEERVSYISSRVVEVDGEEYVVSVARDVTDQERARRRLERQEERYRQLFERNVAGAFRTSLDGEILEANEAFARMVGYDTAAELEGTDVHELYLKPDQRSELLDRLSDQGHLASTELQLVRRDGSHMWVLENSFLVEDPGHHETVNVGTLVDITERKRLERELEEMAYRDPLTGVANRRLLREQVEQELSRLDREGTRGALLFVDLSRFKRVNDTLGHEAGDQVLAQVARRLIATVRGSDVVGRIGGDEFAVFLLEPGDPDSAVNVARRAVEECFGRPFEAGARRIHLGASVGVALYPDHGASFDELLSRSDQAMYRARRESPGMAVQLYAGPAGAPSDELAREDELRRALDREELELRYQPVWALPGREVAGVEALVRWRHPERGVLRPAEFLPLAKRVGLIAEIDRRVFRNVTSQLRRWGTNAPGWVGVNVSAAFLHDPGVREFLEDLFGDSGADPSRLVVEITEQTAMRDPERVREVLTSLRSRGARVAIDDFGTGHSALAYLQQFPTDLIKVDMLFVRGLGESPEADGLVQGIRALADGLGVPVVAEGVEEQRQLDRLTALACDYAQGFHLGRPATVEELEEYL